MDEPLGLLREVVRRELMHLLESFPGRKELVVCPSLLRPLDKVASMSLLQGHDVVRVLPLRDSAPWDAQVARRVFLLRPSLATARLLASQCRANPDRTIAVIWVHRRLAVCDRELEAQGVIGILEEAELNLGLLPLESDLFSLELPCSHRPDLLAVAHCLWQMQSLYGQIPTVYGLGPAAVNAWKLAKKLYAEKGEPRASPDQSVSHLFVFDRQTDPASVLLTGLTYEAQLHDTFKISCGKAMLESKKEGDEGASPSKPRPVLLDNNDDVFASVRNRHMTAVFPYLSAKAREVQGGFDRGVGLAQVQEMKKFVQDELKALRSQHRQLETHICACEEVLTRGAAEGAATRFSLEHRLIAGSVEPTELVAFLEDCCLRALSPWKVLLLACLASVASTGLPAKLLQQFKSVFMHCYGYEYMPVLHTLGTKRLLVEKQKILPTLPVPLPTKASGDSPSLPYLIKRMGLRPTNEAKPVDVKNPDQMSYVFSGAFTPPLCQVVSDWMTRGWQGAELRRTWGESAVFSEEYSVVPAEKRPDSRMRRAVLVFFVGGVSYAEVAALRLLAQQSNFRLIIAATDVVHRETWLQTMAEATVE